MGGMLHAVGAVCVTCNGTGVLPEPVEERFDGYLDGAGAAASLWVVRIKGCSGLMPDEDKGTRPFADRFRINERDALREMEDGLLMEHIGRLRRVLVMAGEDRLPEWWVDLTKARHEMAATELRWRQRAGEKGADRVAADIQWRERVERVKASVDLALLIAYESDKARPAGPGKWTCCCPFHADGSPSLDIDCVKNLWYCHGCGVGGDAFTYVEMRYGLDFGGALRHLEQRL